MAGKKCGQCGEEKSLDEFCFHKSGRRAGTPMSVCKVCNKASQNSRYARRKSGDLTTSPVLEQECLDCRETRPSSEFGVNHARPSGLHRYCRTCMGIRTKMSKYGMTRDQVLDMPESCETCGSEDGLVIDHDHATGAVRGTLCDSCNVALGRIKDNPDVALALAYYLIRSQNVIGAI